MPKLVRYLLIGFGLLIFVVFIGVKVVVEPIITSKVRAYVEAADTDFYSYQFEDLNINLLGGSLRLKEASTKPGKLAFDSLRMGAFDDLDEIFAEEIYISVDYSEYLFNRNVIIDKIRIIDPSITVYHVTKDQENAKDPISIENILSDSFQGVSLNSLTFENSTMVLQDIDKDDPDIELNKLDIDIQNVVFNQSTLDTASVGFVFDFIRISSIDLSLTLNEYNTFSIQEVVIDIETDKDGIPKGSDVFLSGIRYEPSELAIQDIKSGHLRTTTEIASDSVTLKQFKIYDWILNDRLTIEEVEITSPSITSHVNSKMHKAKKKKTSSNVLDKLFKEISVKKFRLIKGEAVVSDIHKSTADLHLYDVGVEFDDFLFNESTTGDPFGFKFSRGSLLSNNAEMDLGEYYSLDVNKLSFDLRKGSGQISGLKMTPKQSHEEFSKIIPYEMDQYTLSVGSVELNGFSFEELSENLGVRLQSVYVNNLDFAVFRDKWVEDQEFVYKPLPSRAIRSLPFPLWIDTLKITESNITYTQLGDVVEYDNELPGEVSFTHLSASAYRVTNNRSALRRNPFLQVDAQATFMGDATLHAQYKFNIPDTMDTHYVTAHMNNFHTASLDPMVKNLLLVEIPDGIIHSIDVNLTGNDTLMTGTLEMEYEHLNINILKTKNPRKSSGFLNMVANGVLRKNNMKDKGKFVVGIVDFDRFRNKSVFNYSWNGIKSGLISTTVPFTKKEKVKSGRKKVSR